MTKREKINRNIGLCFDFLRQALKDPSILDGIPSGSEIEFLDKDFPKKVKSRSGKRINKSYLRVKTEMELIK